jgi:hypothetical protein
LNDTILKTLFDLEAKGQGPTKIIMVHDTPPYGHAPTYQLSLTYLERQKCYGPDKKILFKKQLFDLEVKGQSPTKVIMVRNTPPYGHAPTHSFTIFMSPLRTKGDIVLVLFFLLLPLFLSKACPDHNFFVFRDRSMIYGMWVHDHKVVCCVP